MSQSETFRIQLQINCQLVWKSLWHAAAKASNSCVAQKNLAIGKIIKISVNISKIKYLTADDDKKFDLFLKEIKTWHLN